MRTAKKLLLTTTMVLAMGSFISTAHAEDELITASVQTREALDITAVTQMNFGILDAVIATHTGTIVLATDGTVSVAGATAVTASGTPTAGSVTVAGDDTSVVDISCETGGSMTDGADTLTLSAVTISIDGGADATCDGLGVTPENATLSATDTTIEMGATIDVTTDKIETGLNNYTTAGAEAITLRVVYQ